MTRETSEAVDDGAIPPHVEPLDRAARDASRAADEAAAAHGLSCLVVVYDAAGAFRVAGSANVTVAIGLLHRAATELHISRARVG
jgi:hypothetical protein